MPEAYRVTFEVDGGRIAVKAIRRLTMRAPRGQTPEQRARPASGRAVEVRGAKGEALYRRAVDELLTDTVEYPTGDPARPFGRAPARGRRVISVLVPAHKDARTVAIVETGRRAADARGARAAGDAPTRDLVTVDLPTPDAEPRP